MRVVLDASVAIKFYVREVDSARAIGWLAGDASFFVPDIFLVEVTQALLRHVREGRLGASDLRSAVSDLVRIADVPHGSDELIERALSLADELQHRLHDCIYLALAERLACPLLTADGRLVGKVRGGADLPAIIALDEAPA